MSSPALEAFAAHFKRAASLPGDTSAREAAWQSFRERGFPGPRDEDWRFASLDTIRETAWTAANGAAQPRSGHGPEAGRDTADDGERTSGLCTASKP